MAIHPRSLKVNVVQSFRFQCPCQSALCNSYRYQRQVDGGEKTIVGVNRFAIKDEKRPPILKIDDSIEKKQLDRLAQLRAKRDNPRVEATLAALRDAASNGENLIPHMLDAVRAYASVGEVCNALVPVFGTYREVSVI